MSLEPIAEIAILEAVVTKLSTISKANNYFTDFNELKPIEKIPTAYGFNGLYYRDGKGQGQFGRNGSSSLVFEIEAIIIETKEISANKGGTLAIADLKKAFKNIGICGAVTSTYKSDKFIETTGKTVCKVFFDVTIQYKNTL